MTTFHDFTATDIAGRTLAMSGFAGQVVLVVNTASRCGFTPQLEGLEALHRSDGERGLAVLGFPCNQFGGQDPGSEAEIAQFCQINYGVSFRMMAKVEVNGPGTHPLWQWLKSERPGVLGTRRIKWNFTKFLVGRDGHALHRYGPRTKPEALRPDIEAALAQR